MHSHIVLAPGELPTWLASWLSAHLDIGCGDGSTALAYAREHPDTAVLGLDLCLDNLNRKLRRAPDNLRFIRGDATQPYAELEAQFDSGSIAFPFGSLLCGLVKGEQAAIDHILSPFRPNAWIQVWINESAMRASTGLPPALGPLEDALGSSGAVMLGHRDIRQVPSSWARRIGYGKPSRTWLIAGRKRALAQLPAIAQYDEPLYG